MKIIKSSFEIESIDGTEMLKKIERAGVKCYQTEHLIDEKAKSYLKFVKMIIDNGHLGADKDIKDAVQKEAIKYLEENQTIKEKIGELLTDDNFLKDAVKEMLMEELKNE